MLTGGNTHDFSENSGKIHLLTETAEKSDVLYAGVFLLHEHAGVVDADGGEIFADAYLKLLLKRRGQILFPLPKHRRG